MTAMATTEDPRATTPTDEWRKELYEAVPERQGTRALGRSGSCRLGLGITGHVQARGEVGNLGTDFAFEARPAMHKEGVH